MKINYAYLQLKVDDAFSSGEEIDHERLANTLYQDLIQLSDDDFEYLGDAYDEV